MTQREEGLLCAARQARRRAEEYREFGNKKNRRRIGSGDWQFKIAEELDNLAAWCECEANTYTGASLVVMP
jgi:hypothetical protein